jgi:hypothetical protein
LWRRLAYLLGCLLIALPVCAQQTFSNGVPAVPGLQFVAGAAWTSATSSGTFQYPTGTTTAAPLLGAPGLLAQLDQTSTLTAGAVTWQGTYDNVNWVTIPTSQVLNPNTFAQLTNPYSLVASTNQPFLILTQGYVGVRADLSTAISGTGTVTPYWAALPVGAFAMHFGVNNTSAPSLGTGQTAPLQLDYGADLFVKPYRRSLTAAKATTIAASTSAMTILPAQASGIFCDLASLSITSTPTTTAGLIFTVTISDGTNSYIYDMMVGSNTTDAQLGTVLHFTFNPPLPASSAATAWTQTNSVSTGVTTHTTAVCVLQKAS